MADVVVRFFAAVADAAGRDESMTTATTVAELRSELETRYGADMERALRNASFLIDGVVSRDPQRALGARVDVLPPFAGG